MVPLNCSPSPTSSGKSIIESLEAVMFFTRLKESVSIKQPDVIKCLNNTTHSAVKLFLGTLVTLRTVGSFS